jgi:hypothetical protein
MRAGHPTPSSGQPAVRARRRPTHARACPSPHPDPRSLAVCGTVSALTRSPGRARVAASSGTGHQNACSERLRRGATRRNSRAGLQIPSRRLRIAWRLRRAGHPSGSTWQRGALTGVDSSHHRVSHGGRNGWQVVPSVEP